MILKRGTLQRILTYMAALAGFGWAIFVILRYLGVDNNFLLSLTFVPVNNRLLLIVTGIFLGSILFGYWAGQNYRRKIIIGTFSLILVIAGALLLHSNIQSTWLKVINLTDGVLASLMVAMAALMGVGIGLGTRISRHPLTLGSLAVCLILPFLFITLRAGAIASLLALGWLLVLSDALGMHLLRWLNRLSNSPSASIDRAGLLSVAVGLGILILVTLGLGLIGGTSTTGVFLFLLGTTALCLKQIKSSLTRFAALPWGQPVPFLEFELGGLAALTALFLIYWIDALAPEVGADALGFRMAGPVIWLRDGIIRPLPEMLSSYGMFAGEMLHLLLLPMTGFVAAKVLQFGLAIVLVVSVYVQVFDLRHQKETALILFAFWGSTLAWWQMIWGFVDLSQMFFYFACILALRFWFDEPESPIWLIVAGISGATATSIKLNGAGALVIAGIVVVGVTIYQTRSYAKVITNNLYLAMPAAVCLLPWLIRSYLLTQNPLFPFANEIFKSPLIVEMPVAKFGVGLSFPEIFSVPWGIFFDPARFGSLGTYHPLILALAVLGVTGLIWVSSRKDWLWLGAGTLAYISWLVTEQNSRYSLFAIYLLMLAFGTGLLKWQERLTNRLQYSVIQALFLVGLVGGFGIQAIRPSFWMQWAVSGQALPLKVVLSEQSGFDYLTGILPTYFCSEWLNQHYGQNAKVWQIPPIRDHLYFNAPVSALPHGILTITKPLSDILSDPSLSVNLAAIYQNLVTEGYTHLLYDTSRRSLLGVTSESEWQGVFSAAFEESYLQLECADRGLRLYKIRQIPIFTANAVQLHPNLIENSGFEMFNAAGLPHNWDITGEGTVFYSDGNNVLRLEKDATISQIIAVNDEVPYELSVDYKAISANATATLRISWLDSSGQLRLFWGQPIEPRNEFISYRFLQTAPASVQTVVVYISGSGIDVDNIIFREITSEIPVP